MPRVWKPQLRHALFACLLLGGCGRSGSPAPEEQAASEDKAQAAEQTQAAEEPGPLKEPNPEYYPIVSLKTSLGEVTLKLDAKRAPRTVNNFLHYVQSGHYNETI